MIGTNEDREIVDWRTLTEDGQTVYEIEYTEPVSEPTGRSKSLFGASSGDGSGGRAVLSPAGRRADSRERSSV